MSRLAVQGQALVLGVTVTFGVVIGPTVWVGWAAGQAAVALGVCLWWSRRRPVVGAAIVPPVSALVAAVLLVTGGGWPESLSLGGRGCSELERALTSELEPAAGATLHWAKPLLGDCIADFTSGSGPTALAARFQAEFGEHGWTDLTEELTGSGHVAAATKDGFIFELILTRGTTGRYRAVLYQGPVAAPMMIGSLMPHAEAMSAPFRPT